MQGATGWEGHCSTRGCSRDFGGSNSCFDIAFLHSLAEVARGQDVFSLLKRGHLMLTARARGNKPVNLQGAAKSSEGSASCSHPSRWKLKFGLCYWAVSVLRLALSPGLQSTKWKDAPHCGCPGIQTLFVADNTVRLRFTH